MKKNLKIAITPEQPLDEVVRELERLGYKSNRKPRMHDRYIHTYSGQYGGFYTQMNYGETTTLTELKEME